MRTSFRFASARVLALASAVVAGAPVAGCSPGCDIEQYAASLAGGLATDCGTFARGVDHFTGVDCVMRVQSAGRPFRMVVEAAGRDSVITTAWVRTPDGRRFVVTLDSDPSGGANLGPRMVRVECRSDFVEQTLDGRQTLRCPDAAPVEHVCGRL